MRDVNNTQIKMFDANISDLEFDLRSRDEIPKLLIGLQHIHETPEIRREVENILREVIPHNIDNRTGRRGMSAWEIFVLGTLRLNCNWDFDKLREIANEHRSVRAMLKIPADCGKRYGLQTIRENVQKITPEILDRINQAVVRCGHAQMGDDAKELHGSCDSIVVETDVHFPTDISLLFDAVRKVIILMALIFSDSGLTEWRKYDFNLKKIKKIFNKVRRLKKSTSKNPEVRAAREQLIKEAYQAYTDVIRSILNKAVISIALLRELGTGMETEAKLLEIEMYIAHAERQIDQIDRRIMNGEKIPHDEKIFSVFEEHTEWISKGKAGKPVELGLRVSIVKDQFGFILHHMVHERQTDDKIAVAVTEAVKERYDSFVSCSFDRGYYTPDNKKALKKMLNTLIMPKKGGLSKAEKEEEYSEIFREGRRKHAAVESSLSALENHGFDRCPDHGLHGFKRYAALAVVGRNIQILGHILQQKELKKLKRRERMAA